MMIDLHCHLLPGIDDGPRSVAGALAIAERAAADGIEIVAATPHFRADHPAVQPSELAERCDAIQAEIDTASISLRVVPGAEVDLVAGADATDDQLRLATYGQKGNDLLVETPYGPLTPGFEQMLFDRFIARGFRVLLAHPERNPTFQEEPTRLLALVRRGVLLQVTAGSLIGSRRSRTRRLARALINEGVAHVLASDAHRAPTRVRLSVGAAEASRLDRARAPWMVTEAPAAVLAGEALPPVPRRGRRRLRETRR